MSSSSVLGTLVVRIAAELRQYKADMADAGRVTQDASAKIEQSTGQAGGAAGKLGDKLGAAGKVAGAVRGDFVGAAQGVQVLAAGAGVATLAAGVLVAALAGAAYAAHQGAQEHKAYEKALILTGNAAGTNASQMQAMAASVDRVVGTHYEAAAALAQMAGTGQVAAGNLEKFSEVALEMERTVGQSVGDTVKVFAELGEAPVKASLKLNESMNYLTASTFAQIKAAEDLGDKERAASLAQNAYADAMKTRTAQIEANLGILERAWRGVGAMGKWAWDQMLGLGREQLPSDKIAILEKQLSDRKARNADLGIKDGLASQQLGAEIAALKAAEFQTTESAKAQGALSAANKLGIEAIENLGSANERYADKQSKATKALEEYQREVKNLRAVDPDNVLLKPETIAATEAAIRKSGETAVKASRTVVDANETLIASIKEGMAASQAELELGQKLTPVQREIATLYAKISSSKIKYKQETLDTVKALTDEKLANEQLNTIREAGRKATELASQERLKAIDLIEKDTASLQAQIRKQQDANNSIGMSKRAIAELTRQRTMDTAAILEAKAIKELDRNLDQEKYDATMAQVKAMRELADLKSEGVALQTVHDEAKKAGEEWKKFTDDVERGLTDSLYRAFESGKGFFDTLWSGIKNLFKTTVLKLAVQAVGGGITDALGLTSGKAGGALSSLGGLASNLSSVGSLLTGGGSLSSTIGGLAGAITGLTASNTALGVSIGLSSAEALAAATAASQAGGVSTLLAGLGSVPVYGWIAAAAVAAFMIFSDDGTPSVSTGDVVRKYDASGKQISSETNYGSEQDAGKVTDSLYETFAKIQKTIMSTGGATFGFGGYSGDNNENPMSRIIGGGYVSAEFSTNAAAMATEYSRAILGAIQASDMPASVASIFAGLAPSSATTEQVNQAIQAAQIYIASITELSGAFNLLPFDNIKNLSWQATDALVSFGGGIGNLTSQMAGYLRDFYSASEQRSTTVNQITSALNASGVNLTADQVGGASRADFRAYAESQDLTTTQGQKTYAALMNVSSAFASITKEAQQAERSYSTGSSGGAGAASSIANAWQAITDSIWGEVKRIRGLLEGSGEDAFAAAQMRFTLATAQARAGDQEAAKALPQLSQALLGMAEGNAGTLIELQRIRAQTAASLSITNAGISSKYGTKIPSFDVGTNYVPRDMIAMIHEGEEITPRAYNPAAGGRRPGGGDDSAVVTELRKQNALLVQLLTVGKETKDNTGKIKDVFVRVTHDGEAMQTELA